MKHEIIDKIIEVFVILFIATIVFLGGYALIHAHC